MAGVLYRPCESSSPSIGHPCAARLALGLITILWTISLSAQFEHGSGFGYDFHNAVPDVPDDRVKDENHPAPSTMAADDETCFLPPLAGIRSATRNVSSLKIPRSARKYFQNACRELEHNQSGKAEQSLVKALQQDEHYAEAWILLGQVLKIEKENDQAIAACSEALTSDPNDLRADLCLADLYAQREDWGQSLAYADSAIAADPSGGMEAQFYAAAAYFGMHRLAEAEKTATKAIELDKYRFEPRAHFLLAQIYELQHNSSAEAAQIEEYLKSVTDPWEAALLRKYLASLTATASH
jgi:tetratricopeptide (TPR) repeat protein